MTTTAETADLIELPACSIHGQMSIQQPATPEQAFCGVWYRCDVCTNGTLFPSEQLQAQLRETQGIRKQALAALESYRSGGPAWNVVNGFRHLAAVMKKTGAPIFIFRGTLNRKKFLELVEEARTGGADISRGMTVICDLATYSGAGVDWTRLSELVAIPS